MVADEPGVWVAPHRRVIPWLSTFHRAATSAGASAESICANGLPAGLVSLSSSSAGFFSTPDLATPDLTPVDAPKGHLVLEDLAASFEQHLTRLG